MDVLFVIRNESTIKYIGIISQYKSHIGMWYELSDDVECKQFSTDNLSKTLSGAKKTGFNMI